MNCNEFLIERRRHTWHPVSFLTAFSPKGSEPDSRPDLLLLFVFLLGLELGSCVINRKIILLGRWEGNRMQSADSGNTRRITCMFFFFLVCFYTRATFQTTKPIRIIKKKGTVSKDPGPKRQSHDQSHGFLALKK